MNLVTTFHSLHWVVPARPLEPLIAREGATFRTQLLSPTGLISSLLKANKEKGEVYVRRVKDEEELRVKFRG